MKIYSDEFLWYCCIQEHLGVVYRAVIRYDYREDQSIWIRSKLNPSMIGL